MAKFFLKTFFLSIFSFISILAFAGIAHPDIVSLLPLPQGQVRISFRNVNPGQSNVSYYVYRSTNSDLALASPSAIQQQFTPIHSGAIVSTADVINWIDDGVQSTSLPNSGQSYHYVVLARDPAFLEYPLLRSNGDAQVVPDGSAPQVVSLSGISNGAVLAKGLYPLTLTVQEDQALASVYLSGSISRAGALPSQSVDIYKKMSASQLSANQYALSTKLDLRFLSTGSIVRVSFEGSDQVGNKLVYAPLTVTVQ
jgi:hypothetical protein